MGSPVLPFLLITMITSLASIVVCVAVLWRRASPSTPPPKPLASPPPIQPSLGALAQMQADQADLSSAVEKITTTVKRLTARQGMRDVRERREASAVPGTGASKLELLRHYGLAGKVGPAFAQRQLELEQELREDDQTTERSH